MASISLAQEDEKWSL